MIDIGFQIWFLTQAYDIDENVMGILMSGTIESNCTKFSTISSTSCSGLQQRKYQTCFVVDPLYIDTGGFLPRSP